jgi:4-diphosphocytidyl-2-C-methyl-D-erythritol kinase
LAIKVRFAVTKSLKMLAFSNCKINIGLNIYNQLPNGYHNIETIFYPVNWFDTIELIENKINSVRYTGYGLMVDGGVENNLIVKAYNMLKQDFNLPGADLYLLKNIPMGAGLGGGSANAAAMLKLCNTFFGLNLSNAALESYAAKLGSDCAFFINNKPAYTFGIGGNLKQIDLKLSDYYIGIVKPNVHISTKTAYENAYKRGEKKSNTALTDYVHLPVNEWQNYFTNDFEPYVFKEFKEVALIKDKMYELGALYASMSGSGSAVYGIFKHQPELKKHFNHPFIFSGKL